MKGLHNFLTGNTEIFMYAKLIVVKYIIMNFFVCKYFVKCSLWVNKYYASLNTQDRFVLFKQKTKRSGVS